MKRVAQHKSSNINNNSITTAMQSRHNTQAYVPPRRSFVCFAADKHWQAIASKWQASPHAYLCEKATTTTVMSSTMPSSRASQEPP